MSEEYEDLHTPAHVDKVIGESKELARIFLAINGKDTLKVIAKKLGIPFKRVQQSSEILEKNKLIFIINIPPGKGVIYSKPHWIRFQNIDDHIRVRFWIKDL